MAEARYFCPDCGSIDLMISNSELKDAQGKSLARAECPNCSWAGPLSETTGAITTERFWDAERVGDVLFRVLATRAAGPLVQALEFIGLLPRKRHQPVLVADATEDEKLAFDTARVLWLDPETTKWNRSAQNARDEVMRAIMGAALQAAFTEAEKQNKLHATLNDIPAHPMLSEPTKDREFGGNVTNIKKARAKKRKR